TLHHLDPFLHPEALVTDAGSTKHAIVSTARKNITKAQFLGGHPMAGKERRGVEVADPDLFRDRTWVLTPGSPEELETPIARDFQSWLDRIGARMTILGASQHDWIVAYTSHLPQLASTGLAATVGENVSNGEELKISGPGLADTTRLALSSYDLWRDILATNAEAIEQALTAYIGKLEHLRENLRTRQIREEFDRAATLAATLRQR
ncbi:MAG TPA: prephenate dehydrogenase/arogenate dehydrogenase family protein, partial [Bryobacteraceae bacterium]|nr:prephenate dehydrogenase/arogenate dehydrogenase family protein [Bryobacteraceae bacterium]